MSRRNLSEEMGVRRLYCSVFMLFLTVSTNRAAEKVPRPGYTGSVMTRAGRCAARPPLAGCHPYHIRRGDGGPQLRQPRQAEGSVFTGREPDENRSSFDKPRFDSHSGRLSVNPNTDNALQASYGFIKNAEGDGLNQHRITASWLYNKGLGIDSNFTTAVVWGKTTWRPRAAPIHTSRRQTGSAAPLRSSDGWKTSPNPAMSLFSRPL